MFVYFYRYIEKCLHNSIENKIKTFSQDVIEQIILWSDCKELKKLQANHKSLSLIFYIMTNHNVRVRILKISDFQNLHFEKWRGKNCKIITIFDSIPSSRVKIVMNFAQFGKVKITKWTVSYNCSRANTLRTGLITFHNTQTSYEHRCTEYMHPVGNGKCSLKRNIYGVTRIIPP